MRAAVDSTVMWMTWRQLFAGRRILLAAAVSLAPVVLTALIYFTATDPADRGLNTLVELSREIVIGTLLPLTAAVFGTTAFGGEVEDGTVLHLLTKPVRRWRMVTSKYAVAVASTIAVMVPAALLPWAAMPVEGFRFAMPAGVLAGAVLGAVVYCALFLGLGIMTRRSLVIALVYVIGIEGVLTRNLTGVKSLSVREYAVAAMDRAGRGALPPPDFVVPMGTVWTMSAVLVAGALALTLFKLRRYEVAEKL